MSNHSDNSDYSDCESEYSHGGDLTGDQENVLHFAIGDKTCSDDESNKFIGYLLIAIIITLMFVLLSYRSFDSMFESRVNNSNHRLGIKALFFVFIVFVILWIAGQWQEDNDKNNCKNRRD